MQTWSEFHPTLYALNVTLATNEGKDNIITDFGMRDFATEEMCIRDRFYTERICIFGYGSKRTQEKVAVCVCYLKGGSRCV